MTPTRILIVMLVLVLGLRIALYGDDAKPEAPPDPCVIDLKLERLDKLDNPPQRETKFEESQDPWVANLYDVKVVDQKYIAFIHIRLPHNTGSPYSAENGDRNFGRVSHYLADEEHKELAGLQLVYPSDPLLTPGVTDFFSGGGRPPFVRRGDGKEDRLAIGWSGMLAQIPLERQPGEEMKQFFTAPLTPYYVFFALPGPSSSQGFVGRPNLAGRQGIKTIHVLGATREQVEARTKALLTILDQGFSRPIQKGLLQIRGEYCQQYRDQQEKVAAAEKEYHKMQAEFKEYADFPADTLAGLRVQLFQWDAELAGLEAKVEACNKLLAAGAAGERAKQIEEAKIAAEIELAGCKARRAKSADFIGKVKRREELTRQRDEAEGRLGLAHGKVREIAGRIQVIDEEIETFGPVHLVDDTVVIQPVEWTKE